ncbi:MAG: hypothetical protein FJ291_06205 [Planctomycetes bacterium]|nr:hypothetical protein [Planctomycetota bacterium]
MWKDPIVEEVRRVRDAHAARFGYDLRAIYEDFKARERALGREIVYFPPRPATRAPRSGHSESATVHPRTGQ